MSLPRVLEVEYMDTVEEAAAYDTMDHSHVNRLFVADLLAALGGRSADPDAAMLDVLDLGAGTARIPIELCQQHADARVLAVDAAVHMLELARYNVEIAGLIERVQLLQADAKRLPFRDGLFHVVISNSILHHIPEPLLVVREAARVTAPGGLLFFRDLLRPASAEQLRDLVEQYAGAEAPAARQMFADSLHAALSLSEIRELVATLGFAPESVQATSDRHWTWSTRR